MCSPKRIDPSRSPFIHQRVAVLLETESLEDICEQMPFMELHNQTFKIRYIKVDSSIPYEEQRSIERKLGARMVGKADMRQPDRLFGVTRIGTRWIFGVCDVSSAVWLSHHEKPQHYSTALSTRVARAIVNIAIPEPEGIRAIDPCCGIGTVLIEALSMGMDIVGREINPLAAQGARRNLNHFGYPNVVSLGDMREITEHYDVAIIDMPYNLCSKLTDEEQLSMLRSARSFASKVIIVTTERIDSSMEQAEFQIIDRCQVRKGKFVREIIIGI